MFYFFIAGFALTGFIFQAQADETPIFKQRPVEAIPQSVLPVPESTATTSPPNTPINNAKVYFSYAMEIHSNKLVTSEELVLNLFLIEPNGNIRETPTPQFTLNEGKNIGAFNDAFVITNPLKGNYIIGCLAHLNSSADATISFKGDFSAILKRPSKAEKFISTQIPKLNFSGPEIITLSNNIVLLDSK